MPTALVGALHRRWPSDGVNQGGHDLCEYHRQRSRPEDGAYGKAGDAAMATSVKSRSMLVVVLLPSMGRVPELKLTLGAVTGRSVTDNSDSFRQFKSGLIHSY